MPKPTIWLAITVTFASTILVLISPLKPTIPLFPQLAASLLLILYVKITISYTTTTTTTTTQHQSDQSPDSMSYYSWYDFPYLVDDADSDSDAVADSIPKKENKATKPKPDVEEKEKDDDDDDDVSLDAAWQAMMERGVAKPALRKIATWDDRQRGSNSNTSSRLERSQRGLKKSATSTTTSTINKEEGWRKRSVLVVADDELFSRVETFIKKHHDHLKVQRQESEQRRSFERLRLNNYFYYL